MKVQTAWTRSVFARRARLLSALTGITVLVTMSVSGTSFAAPAGPDSPPTNTTPGVVSAADLHTMQIQSRLQAVADRLHALGSDAGFIFSRMDSKPDALTVFWHGRQGPAVASILSDAKVHDLVVHMASAPFSAAQLWATESRLQAAAPSLGITLIHHEMSGDGFTVQFKDVQSSKAAQGALSKLPHNHAPLVAALASTPAAALVSPDGSPPVRISSVPSNRVQFASGRQNDSSPFYSGGRDHAYLSCTTGFAMHRGSYTDGSHQYLLTAGHCSNFQDNHHVTSATGLAIGVTSAVVTLHNAGYDAGLINVAAHGAGNYMWDGAWNSTNTKKQVKGASGTSQNESLCQSGSYSGTICSILVYDYDDVVSAGKTIHVWTAFKQNLSGAAAGPGDSGAPVFDIVGCGTTCVNAHGLVQGGDTGQYPAPCQGAAESGCSSLLDFTSIQDVERVMGIAINVP